MRIVVALGGNALLHRGERPDADVQQANIERAVTALAPLACEHELVITHGNGPQIGLLAVESDSDPALSAPYPLDVLGAQTQGMIGSLLARSLHDALPGRTVSALVTHTVVAADDPAFQQPTKFVGQVRTREEAEKLCLEHGWDMAEDSTGWRRVVPSPKPERIVEIDVVRALLLADNLVICAGGGGVPVTREVGSGRLRGVEAVIDKDLTAALLAEELKADFLLILTDVSHVFTGYGTEHQRPIGDTTPGELRRHPFPGGSMKPKIEAAAGFVERTGRHAAIGALDDAGAVVEGATGTRVSPDPPAPPAV